MYEKKDEVMFSLKTEQNHYLSHNFNLLRIMTTDE